MKACSIIAALVLGFVLSSCSKKIPDGQENQNVNVNNLFEIVVTKTKYVQHEKTSLTVYWKLKNLSSGSIHSYSGSKYLRDAEGHNFAPVYGSNVSLQPLEETGEAHTDYVLPKGVKLQGLKWIEVEEPNKFEISLKPDGFSY